MPQRPHQGRESGPATPALVRHGASKKANFSSSTRIRLMHPEGPHPGVLHDGQAGFRGLAAAQAVHGVRQAVQVEAAGDLDTSGSRAAAPRPRARKHRQEAQPGPQKHQSPRWPPPRETRTGSGPGPPAPPQAGARGTLVRKVRARGKVHFISCNRFLCGVGHWHAAGGSQCPLTTPTLAM